MPSRVFLMLIVCALWILSAGGPGASASFGDREAAALAEKAKEMAADVKAVDGATRAEAREAGMHIGEFMLSAGHQNKVEAHAERLRREVFTADGAIKSFYPDSAPTAGKGRVSGHYLSGNERVYVFISSSIPLRTTRTYAGSIDVASDPNVVMVMRGMVGGVARLGPTMEFLAGVLTKDPTCLDQKPKKAATEECESFAAEVLIDPLLFRRYAITRVPAVVYVQGVRAQDPEGSEGDVGNAQAGKAVAVYGDSALDGVLETIAESTKSSTLGALVDAMRRHRYY